MYNKIQGLWTRGRVLLRQPAKLEKVGENPNRVLH